MTPPPPPTSPLADPPPDPRVLTRAEVDRLVHLRLVHSWYSDVAARVDVRFLLDLVDRVTAASPPPVVTDAELTRLRAVRARRPWYTVGADSDVEPAGDAAFMLRLLDRLVPPPVATPPTDADLLGRLDGLRAELGVLLDDARTSRRLPWTLAERVTESLDTVAHWLTRHPTEGDPP